VGCCSKTRRKAVVASAPLPGSDGWALVGFRGKTAFKLPSRTTNLVYDFEPGEQMYVDIFDVPMLLLWQEDDEQVFFEVDEWAR